MTNDETCPRCGSDDLYYPHRANYYDAYCNECERGFTHAHGGLIRKYRRAKQALREYVAAFKMGLRP